MDPFKFLLRFALKFLVVYIGLLLLFSLTGGDNMVRDFYGHIGESIFQNWSDHLEIHVKPAENAEGDDLLFQIVDKEKLEVRKAALREGGKKNEFIPTLGFYTNSRTTFLMPLIFFLALIIAYPSDLRHKLPAFFIGLLPLLFYIFFKLGCMLFYSADTDSGQFPDYELSNFTNGFLRVVYLLFIEAAYMIAVVIWVLVCVRKKDFKDLLE